MAISATFLEALAIDSTEPTNTMKLYEDLAKTYSYLGNPAKAAEYFDKHNELPPPTPTVIFRNR
jgi:hypothetical protein